jgi:hypothetical protein
MNAERLGSGAVVAGLSAVVVLIGIFFLDWYDVDTSAIAPVQIHVPYLAQLGPSPTQVPNDLNFSAPASFSAWDSADLLAVIANIVILAAAFGALGALYSLSRGTLSEGAVPGLTLLSAAAVVMVVLRMIFPVEDHLTLASGIWFTLAGTVGLLAGSVMMRRDLAGPQPGRERPSAS